VHVKLRLYTLENSVARTEISLSLSCECARESVDVLPRRSIRKERGDDLWRNLFKDGGERVCAREVLVCGEFLFAKMWFIRQRQMVLVFLILRSYDEDDDNEEESEKSSSSSTTSGLSGLGACSTPPS
jgi:hypothetical protein